MNHIIWWLLRLSCHASKFHLYPRVGLSLKSLLLEEDDKKLVNQTTNKNKNTNNPRVVSKNYRAGAGACQQAQVRNYQSAYPTNWVSPRTHSASKTQLRLANALSACEHNTLLPGNPINRQSRPSPAPGPRRPELSWSTRSPGEVLGLHLIKSNFIGIFVAFWSFHNIIS